MQVKKCGLLGGKLGHSFSPQIHALLADYDYELFPMPETEVEGFMKNGTWDAINVTIPYKETVIPYLDTVSEEARLIGSVNTVVRDDNGKMHGHNTDFYGFSYLLERGGFEISGKKCIVLGSGGSCKTVKSVLASKGAGEVYTVSRSGEYNYENISLLYDAEIIVNTTPVGMFPKNGERLLELCKFTKCTGVVDIVYNPAMTGLLLDAERLGIKHSDGLPMLVAQAKRACEIFRGEKISDGVIEDILGKLRMQMMNITLVGMPGCGKTTVGNILAQRLKREIYDTDAEICKKGRTPSDIITNDGEETFRRVEHETVEETGKLSGKIIATGGGVVTREENYEPLHQNGKIIFINRPIQLLATDGRPLSQRDGVERLYNTRLPMYRRFADAEVDGSGTAEEVAQRIMDALEVSEAEEI